MLVTLFGIVTLLRLEQLPKADGPMFVTLLGMVTPVSVAEFLNASHPMLLTVFGTVRTAAEPLYFIKTPSPAITKSSA